MIYPIHVWACHCHAWLLQSRCPKLALYSGRWRYFQSVRAEASRFSWTSFYAGTEWTVHEEWRPLLSRLLRLQWYMLALIFQHWKPACFLLYQEMCSPHPLNHCADWDIIHTGYFWPAVHEPPLFSSEVEYIGCHLSSWGCFTPYPQDK